MRYFYGTGIEIWAGFGPIGSIKKTGSGPIMSNLLRVVFMFSGAKTNVKIFLETFSVYTKKLHKMKLRKLFFLRKKIMFFMC